MTEAKSDGGTTVRQAPLSESEPETTTEVGLRRQVRLAGRQLGTLAASEIRLGLRRRWGWILAGLFAAFGLLVLTFAGSAPGPAGLERIASSFAVLCVYVVPLAALAYGYDTVVGPAERGWLEVLSALPVTRVRILLGAILGRSVVLTGGLLLGFSLPAAVLLSEYGAGAWPAVATVVLAATALGLAFLAVAVALSTLVREKTHALGLALLAWVWFVLVHDLLALGVLAAFDLPDWSVLVLIVANPVSTYRVLVLNLLGASGAGGFTGALSVSSVWPGLLAGALLAWTLVPIVLVTGFVRWRGTIAAT